MASVLGWPSAGMIVGVGGLLRGRDDIGRRGASGVGISPCTLST